MCIRDRAGVRDVFATRTIRALARRLDETDERPGRLAEVAALYLEVAAMDDEAVAAEVGGLP